jgi:hypothetical protein
MMVLFYLRDVCLATDRWQEKQKDAHQVWIEENGLEDMLFGSDEFFLFILDCEIKKHQNLRNLGLSPEIQAKIDPLVFVHVELSKSRPSHLTRASHLWGKLEILPEQSLAVAMVVYVYYFLLLCTQSMRGFRPDAAHNKLSIIRKFSIFCLLTKSRHSYRQRMLVWASNRALRLCAWLQGSFIVLSTLLLRATCSAPRAPM